MYLVKALDEAFSTGSASHVMATRLAFNQLLLFFVAIQEGCLVKLDSVQWNGKLSTISDGSV